MRRVLLCFVVAFSVASPARADETIALLTDPTPVDAYAGRLVWSELVPGTQSFRLTAKVGDGAALPVGVPDRRGAFDVDLGPGDVAVYSRGGTIRLLDLRTGRERDLGIRGHLPAIWRDRIAYVRDRRLYVRALGGAAREVRGGRGAYEQIDLRGGRVAFARRRPKGEGHEYQLLVGRGGHVARLVDRAASGALSSVALRKPRLLDGAIVYARSRYADAGNRFLRVALPGGRSREAVSRQGIVAAAFDAGRFLYVRSTFPPGEGCGDAACTLALSDPVAFR